MKTTAVYLVMDMPYEGFEIVDAFFDKEQAERRMEVLQKRLARWEDKQRAMEAVGNEDA